MANDDEHGDPEERPAPAARKTSDWLRPGGISAIAGVAAVLVALVGILVTLPRANPGPAPGPASAPASFQLFVYGTSMPGQARYAQIEPYVAESRRDTAQGVLYDSGLGYPLAKFGPGDTIPGWTLVLDAETAEEALRIQTRVEAGLFQPTTIRTGSGATATAYEWIDATDGFPRIDRWDGSTADFGATIEESALEVGDCFQDTATRGIVQTMWCQAPHAYEVFHRSADADGDDCAAAFEEFVGLAPADSQLGLTTRAPESGAPLCVAFMPGELTTGSLEGARR